MTVCPKCSSMFIVLNGKTDFGVRYFCLKCDNDFMVIEKDAVKKEDD